jgi:hypothetical protein
MKKIATTLLLSFALFSLSAVGQTTDTLHLAKLTDAAWLKKYSNGTQFSFITFRDGSTLGIGEMIRFGSPSGTNQSTNQNSGVVSGSVTRTNNFSYIMLGRMGMAIMTGVTYLPEAYKGREAAIQNIKLIKNKRGSGVVLILQNPAMDISVLDLEFALKYGEIINPKAPMSSDEALAALKKAKDKLDLGLISQQQFDSVKTVLAKFIK